MTERPNKEAECGPLITEDMVEQFPILKDLYFDQRNRYKETGRSIWIQRDFDSDQERVMNFYVEAEATPSAYIIEDLKTKFCRSFVRHRNDHKDDDYQEVTAKDELIDGAQLRVAFITSRISRTPQSLERGDPEIPGLP